MEKMPTIETFASDNNVFLNFSLSLFIGKENRKSIEVSFHHFSMFQSARSVFILEIFFAFKFSSIRTK